MFLAFFYKLKEMGIPVSPTAFLTLHRALSSGLISTLNQFYTASRAILVKSERYFDIFDQVFANHFHGVELPETEGLQIDELARTLLEQWLKDPKEMARIMGLDESAMARMTPEELIEYFKKKLKEQDRRHDGGDKWIGTAGVSPLGNYGDHPGGMRVFGVARNMSAVKVAMDRRYRNYALSGPLTQDMVGEALKRLRNMRPEGPKDQVNIEETIYRTMKNGGEIEIAFDRRMKDRLKVILAIDNGGWSMDPYVSVVQTLFDYANAQFKEVKTLYFHNTIYETIWKDPARYRRPVTMNEMARMDPESRLIIVGDASMAPYELMSRDGSIHVRDRSGRPSIECLRMLVSTFPHSVWLNPASASHWSYTRTTVMIQQIFPMFELSIDGLEKAVRHLMAEK